MMKPVYLFLFFAFSLFSCSSEDAVSVAKPVEIRVSTGFVAGGVETRGGGSINTGGILAGAPLPLSVVRVDQEESSGAFLPYTATNTNNVGQAPRSARLEGQNGGLWVFFDRMERYLLRASNNKTKLIGWYPAVGAVAGAGRSVWSVADVDGTPTASVGFSIDGDTDILFSGLVEGSMNTPFNDPGNRLVFNHLLTRLMVRVFTTDPNTSIIWGGLKSITLKDAPRACVVTLPGVGAASGTIPSVVGFSGSGDLPVYASGATPLTIPLADEQVKETIGGHDYVQGAALAGSVLAAPAATSTVTLEVVTENITRSITIPTGGFTTNGFAAGNSYTLSLRFMDSAIEFAGVTIHDWETDEVIEKDI